MSNNIKDMTRSVINPGYRADMEKLRLAQKQNEDIESLLLVSIQQKDSIQQLKEISEVQGRVSTRLTKLSLAISILAVILAGIAAVFSIIDYKGDISWQEAQIQVLGDIKDYFSHESVSHTISF